MSSLLELIKKKRQALSTDRERPAKIPDGRSRWRILPSWRDPSHPSPEVFWHDFGQHFIKDGSGQLKAVYVCVDKTFGRPCEVCDAITKGIANAPDDDVAKHLKDAGAATRVLVNALHRDGPTPNDPVILELGTRLFSDLLGIIAEWGPQTLDLDGGRDVIIERVGKGLNTKYSIQIAATCEPVPASVMGSVKNLDEYVEQESEEQKVRAIANVRATAGLLSEPGAYKPTPAALPAAAAASTRAAELASVADELEVGAADETAAWEAEASSGGEAVAQAVAADDGDLDALLSQLT